MWLPASLLGILCVCYVPSQGASATNAIIATGTGGVFNVTFPHSGEYDILVTYPSGQTRRLYVVATNRDTDNDGLPDWQENELGIDPTKTDTDGDGLSDGDEVNVHGTSPGISDTDDDGMPDGWELQYGFNPRSGLSTNLVGWWRFDEDAWPVVFDSSGYENHGLATNMTAWPRVPGYPSGWALEFDGVDDEVVVPHDDSLMPTSAITISAWIYAYPGIGGVLISKGFDGYLLSTSEYNGKNYVWLDVFSVESGSAFAWIEIPTGKWVHIVAAWEETDIGLYANGIAGTNNYIEESFSLNTNIADVVIGSLADLHYNYAGLIADVRIYDTALSPEAVTDLLESVADSDGDGLNNLDEFRHGSDPLISDTDGDGAHDGREVNAGFDPRSSNSLPVNISGVVTYAGRQPGTIHVVAVTNSGIWATNYSATLSDPGAYAIFDAPGRTNLWLRAFRDMNTNGVADPFEAWGDYALNPVNATGDISGIVIQLSDPDLDHDNMPDWWEVQHWGNTNQAAGADADSDGLNNTQEYENRTDPWSSDTDGDGDEDGIEFTWGSDPVSADSFLAEISGVINNATGQTGTGTIWVFTGSTPKDWPGRWSTAISTPGVYVISNVPTLNDYWIKAYRDLNANGTKDFWEPYGEYLANPIHFSDSVVGMDVTLSDPDTDQDGLPDYWELLYFLNLAQTGFMDFDHDGVNNRTEWEQGADPGGLWLDAAGKGLATVRWNVPCSQGVTFYSYDLFEDGIPFGSSASFGDSGTTSVTLSGLTAGKPYRIELRANGASGMIWGKALEWTQPGLGDGADISTWQLFPDIPEQSAPVGSPSILMTTEVDLSMAGSGPAWFFISNDPAAAGGWSLTGLRLEAVRDGTTYTLGGYNHNNVGDSMPLSASITGDGSGTVVFRLNYDGMGTIGLKGPLYLLRWAGSISFDMQFD